MWEVVTQWRHTRMVALTALCGAIYAAVLIPFKVFPIVPGFTEFRPANALPILFSFAFGPAAAWGAAFGNTLGDFFGTLGVGTLFGFVGNFAFGYIPYRLWRVLGGGSPVPSRAGQGRGEIVTWWVRFLVCLFLASLACAVFIAWPLHASSLAPFQIVAPVIFLNDFVMAGLLAPPLLLWIYPRAERLGLQYRDIMEPEDLREPIAGKSGLLLLAFGLVTALLVGLLFRHGLNPGWTPSLPVATAPFVVLSLVGLLLI